MEIPIYRKKIDPNTNKPILDELGNEIMEFICYEIPYEPMQIEIIELIDTPVEEQKELPE